MTLIYLARHNDNYTQPLVSNSVAIKPLQLCRHSECMYIYACGLMVGDFEQKNFGVHQSIAISTVKLTL